MSVRIMLVDDHPVVRAGLSALISDIDGFEVVGQASNGAQGLQMACSLQPDIVLMDIHMPGMSGLECMQHIALQAPAVRILILSMHASEPQVLSAMELGARGYVLKGADPQEIELAIRTVSSGALWYSSGVSQLVLGKKPPVSGAAVPPETLTPRQTDILKRLANGESTKEIAFGLGVSIKTVETHRTQMMERLNIRDVAGLVRYAIRTGLITA